MPISLNLDMEIMTKTTRILLDIFSSQYNPEKDEWGDIGHHYPQQIIERFKQAAHTIRQAQEMVQRVDWLVSGDDGEETFLSRWCHEVREYFQSEEV